MEDRIESPFSNNLYRISSSPPSPVLLFPPSLFIAIASVVCASQEMEPNDIAPVANLLYIFSAGSTSSIDIAGLFGLNSNNPLSVQAFSLCSFTSFEYFLNIEKSPVLVECWSK